MTNQTTTQNGPKQELDQNDLDQPGVGRCEIDECKIDQREVQHEIDQLKRQCNLLFKRYREKIFQKHSAEAHEIKALDDEIDAILDSYQRCKGEWEKKEQAVFKRNT